MTTRTIVTSQPDVACDVCERRLLRGENPDVFIAAGRRRIVCELCAPRAAHEGWLRESETDSLTMPPLRPRRGRSFIDKLRQVGRPPLDPADIAGASVSGEAPSYDFLDGGAAPVPATPGARAQWHSASEPWSGEENGAAPADPAPARKSYVERALEVFNVSEYPRRVAGVARSLGAPEVSARSAEHLSSVVLIVVAWELCWYRYEVDLSDGMTVVRVLDQGTELGELPHDDRLANAVSGEAGQLRLSAT
jgi:hypothetical protein